MKPKLFVGSSVEGLGVAYAVQQNLKHQAEVTVWDQGIFRLSDSALDSLIQLLDRVDFGVFVFTPDDIVNIRGEENRSIRDNVLFELGLFVGRLGKGRSFILMPDERKDFRLPTDLIGMTPATYETGRTDDNFQAATGPSCHEIRQLIASLGSKSKGNESPSIPQSEDNDSESKSLGNARPIDEQAEEKVEATETIEAGESNWRTLYNEDKFEEAISLLEKRLGTTEDEKQKLDYMEWIGRAKAKIDFESGVEYLNRLIEKHPDNEDLYFSLAGAYWDVGLADDAIAILDKGLSSQIEDNSWLKYMKANIKSSQSEEDVALRLIDEIIKENPKFAHSYTVAAEILTKIDRKDEAIKYYELGIKAVPNNEDILYEYGKHLLDVDNNSGALVIFRKLTNRHPKNSNYFGYLGNAYLVFNFYGLALEAYEEANKLAEEEESWLISNIGNVLNSRGFYPQAIKHLKKGIELYPDSVYAHERLASAMKSDEEERKRATETVRQYLLSQKKQEVGQDKQKQRDDSSGSDESSTNEKSQ
ncbi:MAG: nucleotide-binding protein [Pyrinomonadaceae bacterium]|nr:nucleotide-binding protein [Pyrinomonadaceae bacterium]